MANQWTVTLCVSLLALFGFSCAAVAEHKIKHLPGMRSFSLPMAKSDISDDCDEVDLGLQECPSAELDCTSEVRSSGSFDMYSGFITVNETYMTKSFYWFITAAVENPEDAPLIIWLAGGPGCSGLFHLLAEFGPFFPHRDLRLCRNKYSWNKVANLLLVESPIGVGFSYSEVPIDFVHNDQTTTSHNLQFLIKFFDLYPEFANSPFWVTGSSYGGHYVPYLTEAIVEYNKQAPSRPVNLQGFLASNPITHAPDDSRGCLDYWLYNGLISEATYNNILSVCDFTHLGPFLVSPSMLQSHECTSEIQQAHADIGIAEPFFYPRDNCVDESDIDPTSWIPRNPVKDKFHDPCFEVYLHNYLQDADVIQALHAEDSPNGPWVKCRWPESLPFEPKGLNFSAEVTFYDSMLPVYQRLFAEENLRILVYNGEADPTVTHTGTERWIKSLNLTVVKPFRPWFAFDGQLAGHAVEYSDLTYVLVAGAGHNVGLSKPHHVLELFNDFITGVF